MVIPCYCTCKKGQLNCCELHNWAVGVRYAIMILENQSKIKKI